jgi:hypothetical protein
VIVARPNSNDGPPQRREGEVIRIDEPWRGDPTMTGPPFLGKEGVSLERQKSTTMKKPIACGCLLAGRYRSPIALAASKLKGER